MTRRPSYDLVLRVLRVLLLRRQRGPSADVPWRLRTFLDMQKRIVLMRSAAQPPHAKPNAYWPTEAERPELIKALRALTKVALLSYCQHLPVT